eukprot:TRINITY_DN20533_c0_g1_i3.p1 TRINITY_DN20533_c0_g1~~TRINITY_DN20533_c0_g1_i3.p1  ORF type:complete len:1932 (-),score=255.85 TRINITY_DN20533_c0_g1_i3:140-5488(-)
MACAGGDVAYPSCVPLLLPPPRQCTDGCGGEALKRDHKISSGEAYGEFSFDEDCGVGRGSAKDSTSPNRSTSLMAPGSVGCGSAAPGASTVGSAAGRLRLGGALLPTAAEVAPTSPVSGSSQAQSLSPQSGVVILGARSIKQQSPTARVVSLHDLGFDLQEGPVQVAELEAAVAAAAAGATSLSESEGRSRQRSRGGSRRPLRRKRPRAAAAVSSEPPRAPDESDNGAGAALESSGSSASVPKPWSEASGTLAGQIRRDANAANAACFGFREDPGLFVTCGPQGGHLMALGGESAQDGAKRGGAEGTEVQNGNVSSSSGGGALLMFKGYLRKATRSSSASALLMRPRRFLGAGSRQDEQRCSPTSPDLLTTPATTSPFNASSSHLSPEADAWSLSSNALDLRFSDSSSSGDFMLVSSDMATLLGVPPGPGRIRCGSTVPGGSRWAAQVACDRASAAHHPPAAAAAGAQAGIDVMAPETPPRILVDTVHSPGQRRRGASSTGGRKPRRHARATSSPAAKVDAVTPSTCAETPPSRWPESASRTRRPGSLRKGGRWLVSEPRLAPFEANPNAAPAPDESSSSEAPVAQTLHGGHLVFGGYALGEPRRAPGNSQETSSISDAPPAPELRLLSGERQHYYAVTNPRPAPAENTQQDASSSDAPPALEATGKRGYNLREPHTALRDTADESSSLSEAPPLPEFAKHACAASRSYALHEPKATAYIQDGSSVSSEPQPLPETSRRMKEPTMAPHEYCFHDEATDSESPPLCETSSSKACRASHSHEPRIAPLEEDLSDCASIASEALPAHEIVEDHLRLRRHHLACEPRPAPVALEDDAISVFSEPPPKPESLHVGYFGREPRPAPLESLSAASSPTISEAKPFPEAWCGRLQQQEPSRAPPELHGTDAASSISTDAPPLLETRAVEKAPRRGSGHEPKAAPQEDSESSSLTVVDSAMQEIFRPMGAGDECASSIYSEVPVVRPASTTRRRVKSQRRKRNASLPSSRQERRVDEAWADEQTGSSEGRPAPERWGASRIAEPQEAPPPATWDNDTSSADAQPAPELYLPGSASSLHASAAKRVKSSGRKKVRSVSRVKSQQRDKHTIHEPLRAPESACVSSADSDVLPRPEVEKYDHERVRQHAKEPLLAPSSPYQTSSANSDVLPLPERRGDAQMRGLMCREPRPAPPSTCSVEDASGSEAHPMPETNRYRFVSDEPLPAPPSPGSLHDSVSIGSDPQPETRPQIFPRSEPVPAPPSSCCASLEYSESEPAPEVQRRQPVATEPHRAPPSSCPSYDTSVEYSESEPAPEVQRRRKPSAVEPRQAPSSPVSSHEESTEGEPAPEVQRRRRSSALEPMRAPTSPASSYAYEASTEGEPAPEVQRRRRSSALEPMRAPTSPASSYAYEASTEGEPAPEIQRRRRPSAVEPMRAPASPASSYVASTYVESLPQAEVQQEWRFHHEPQRAPSSITSSFGNLSEETRAPLPEEVGDPLHTRSSAFEPHRAPSSPNDSRISASDASEALPHVDVQEPPLPQKSYDDEVTRRAARAYEASQRCMEPSTAPEPSERATSTCESEAKPAPDLRRIRRSRSSRDKSSSASRSPHSPRHEVARSLSSHFDDFEDELYYAGFERTASSSSSRSIMRARSHSPEPGHRGGSSSRERHHGRMQQGWTSVHRSDISTTSSSSSPEGDVDRHSLLSPRPSRNERAAEAVTAAARGNHRRGASAEHRRAETTPRKARRKLPDYSHVQAKTYSGIAQGRAKSPASQAAHVKRVKSPRETVLNPQHPV